jgi:alpha-1,3-fucosyltransferase
VDFGIGAGDRTVSESSHQHPRSQQFHGDMKRILFWNEYFQSKNYEFGLGHEPFVKAGCQFSNCVTTDDRKLLNVSDAVLFHAMDFDELDFPSLVIRRSDQRFIFYNYETCVGEKDMPVFVWTKDFFNWTMTYRRDSDIYDPHPYGSIRRRSDVLRPSLVMPRALHPEMTPAYPAALIQPWNKSRSLVTKKTKMVAWFVSHCHTDGLREEYFGQLGKYVGIDVYGRCGKLNCLPSRSSKCDQLLDSYKFYVAAENAICTDYVTEKFYRALSSDIVPIVYGGVDYSSYAPPLSYIDVSDFKSPKDLADYLKLLDENDGLYLKYFDWKKDYEVVSRPVTGWCELCEKLNDPHQRPKVYKDISDWWFQNDMACVSGGNFLSGSLGVDLHQRPLKSI